MNTVAIDVFVTSPRSLRGQVLRQALCATLVLCALAPRLDAKTSEEGSPGCHEAPIPRIDSLPAPVLYDGVGQSEMKVSTDSAEAQAFFNQGLRMLHGFWSFEAYRAFKHAAELDPQLAMAYWGVHRSIGQSKDLDDLKQAAVSKVEELKESVTEHERLYLELVTITEETPQAERQDKIRRQWELIIDRFPDDVEAKLFLALSLMAGYDEEMRPKENQIYSQLLLRDVLRTHPGHAAAHHYWIHSVEYGPRPEEGLASAHVIASLAPDASHLVHMPGHIHFRLGDYNRAYEIFHKGWRLDHRYLADQGIEPLDHWNYVHNIGFLVAASAESGRYEAGVGYAREIVEASLEDRPTSGPGSWIILYQGWSSMVDLHLRFGRYDKAVAELEKMAEQDLLESAYAEHWIEAQRLYAKARSALSRSEVDEARNLVNAFDAQLWRQPETPDPSHDGDPGDAGQKIDDPLKAKFEMNQFKVFSYELRGLLAAAQGNHDEAVAWLEKAIAKEKDDKLAEGDPPAIWRSASESLAEILLETDPQKAADHYLELMEVRPESGFALYGLARARSLAGDTVGAADSYARFLQAWQHADGDMPQLQTAKLWLEGRPSIPEGTIADAEMTK